MMSSGPSVVFGSPTCTRADTGLNRAEACGTVDLVCKSGAELQPTPRYSPRPAPLCFLSSRPCPSCHWSKGALCPSSACLQGPSTSCHSHCLGLGLGVDLLGNQASVSPSIKTR